MFQQKQLHRLIENRNFILQYGGQLIFLQEVSLVNKFIKINRTIKKILILKFYFFKFWTQSKHAIN